MPEHSVGPDWDALRIRLQDAANTDAEAYLKLLEDAGQHDPLFAGLWTASGVEQARKLGQPDVAARWLRRSLELGWFQANLVNGYQEVLDVQPDAAQLNARLRANLPAPPVELLDWPDAPPTYPLPGPDLSAERLDLLRTQLPEPEVTATGTALKLLTWAHTRWAHAGANPAGDSDALDLLERARQGERFRCVEYGLLLTAALQARGIPALLLGLTVRDYHAGLGSGHVVTAAWLDDLNEWVVLDGQNGALWHDGPDRAGQLRPLGVRELQRRFTAGEARPDFTEPDGTPVTEPDGWWTSFAQANPAGQHPVTERFVPYFQGEASDSRRVTRNTDAVWPDLSGLTTRVVVRDGQPRLKFDTAHPYAVGVAVNGEAVPGDGRPFPAEAGDSHWMVQALGPFGPLRGHPLHCRVRG